MAQIINLDVVYRILRRAAKAKEILAYFELSDEYQAATQVYIHYRGWGPSLGDVSRRCTNAGFPPVSTIVVVNKTGLPGYNYWGHVAGAPRTYNRKAWERIRDSVWRTSWPVKLP
jgi:hypothetical protein